MTTLMPTLRGFCVSSAMWSIFLGLLLNTTSARAQETTARTGPATAEAQTGENTTPANAEADPEKQTQDATSETAPEDSTAKSKAKDEEEEIPLSSQPYVILASIAFERHCLADEARREDVVQDVRRSLARIYGRLWNVQCVQNDWLVPGGKRHLQRLDLPDVLERYPETEFHKAFLVTIEGDRTEFQVSCREYDTRIQELTPVSTRSVRDPRAIGTTAGRMMRDVFVLR